MLLCILFAVLPTLVFGAPDDSKIKFPADFSFGVSTSAYQVEGGWDKDGKGENNWDRFCHRNPLSIVDTSNADIGCDSYHQYKTDVQNIKKLGVDKYRFSISWSRILPEGHGDEVNQAGIDYYNNLINELLANGIEPIVTIFHWDLPQALVDIGGWPNPVLSDYYYDYAKILFDNFADRVKYWSTFNEPLHFCIALPEAPENGMPGMQNGIEEYECGHTVLIAHARVYHLYHDNYAKHGGAIGLSLNSLWCDPKTPNDLAAQERCLDFQIGWYAHPIFSPKGNYPPHMMERIANLSEAQHFKHSRLPSLTEDEINLVRGTADFFGLNYYITRIVKDDDEQTVFGHTARKDSSSFIEDMGIQEEVDPLWEQNSEVQWLQNHPQGLYDILMYIKEKYNNPVTIITENGWVETPLEDQGRIHFLEGHLEKLSEAVQDGANVKGYVVWSLMDAFEWRNGYTSKFGLYHVNFTDPARTRTPRASAKWLRQTIDAHRRRHGLL